ncbi:MAG: type II secretion system protein GspG [Verrucomicrobiota bacterium]
MKVLALLIVAGVLLLVVPHCFNMFGGMPHTTTVALFVRQSMKTSLTAFNRDIGRYPTTEEGLAALSTCPSGAETRWRGPYVDVLPADPWGRLYQYLSPAAKSDQGYDLWSLGADGITSADDIGNWQNS